MIYYLGLEPYQERYTELLTGWVLDAATRTRSDLVALPGRQLAGAESIRVGQVLDAHGRGYWALTQTAALLAMQPQPSSDDWIWIDDMFHPGIEALFYLWAQLDEVPRLAVRNHAQSVDPDDFTFPMRAWMRRYEQMVCQVADVVFVASSAHREMMEAACLDQAPIKVVGLPFDRDATRALGPDALIPWHERLPTVVFSSRFDSEKQPHFFLDIVDRMADEADFVFCTGSDRPRSNDPLALERLHQAAADGKIEIRTGLTKRAYYAVLADASVQINTARQDFVSYTACEASTFATPTLAPAYRAFPETLENRESQMYVPWSVTDACDKLRALLDRGEPDCVRVADYNHGSIERILEHLT